MASDFDDGAWGISGWHAWHNHNLSVLIKSAMQVRGTIDVTGCISLNWDEGKLRSSLGANIIDMCNTFEIDNHLEIKNVYLTHLNVPPMSYMLGEIAWWRHQMETFSALLGLCTGNSPVPGEFPAQRPMTRSFDVFCDLRLNKRLSKQSWGW